MQKFSSLDGVYESLSNDSKAKRRGINSVEIGVRVLEAVVSLNGPCTLKAIAEKSGMEPSQTHRYVSSLLNCGLLMQERNSSLYDLGPQALHLGVAAIARLDPLNLAAGKLRDFSTQQGATCLLSVWGPNGPTIIGWFQGSPPVYTVLTIGSTLPLTESASGHIFMSFLAESYLTPLLEKEGFKSPLIKNAKLMAILERVRASFSSYADSTVIPGLGAHAAPILGLQGVLVGVATVIYNDAVSTAERDEVNERLLAASKEISEELGGEWKPK